MTKITSQCKPPALHDTIRVGVWVQNTLSRNVYQVHQIDPDGKRVELVSDIPGREPLWAPFWIIDIEYRQVAR